MRINGVGCHIGAIRVPLRCHETGCISAGSQVPPRIRSLQILKVRKLNVKCFSVEYVGGSFTEGFACHQLSGHNDTFFFAFFSRLLLGNNPISIKSNWLWVTLWWRTKINKGELAKSWRQKIDEEKKCAWETWKLKMGTYVWNVIEDYWNNFH